MSENFEKLKKEKLEYKLKEPNNVKYEKKGIELNEKLKEAQEIIKEMLKLNEDREDRNYLSFHLETIKDIKKTLDEHVVAKFYLANVCENCGSEGKTVQLYKHEGQRICLDCLKEKIAFTLGDLI